MVNTGTAAKYIAIAAPLRAECKPILSAVNPNKSGPMVEAANRRRFRS